MENRIIRDKINSLHTLPEGYHPSLDSKWELLETALAGSKKSYTLYYMAIAATLLLLFSIGWVLYVNNNKANNITPVVVKHETENTAPISIKDQAQDIVKVEETVNHASLHDKRNISISKQEKKPVPAKQIVSDSQRIETPGSVVVHNTIIAEPSKTPKKKRYNEMEFNAPPVQENRYNDMQANAALRIKLLSPSYSNTPPGPDQATVGLKRSF